MRDGAVAAALLVFVLSALPTKASERNDWTQSAMRQVGERSYSSSSAKPRRTPVQRRVRKSAEPQAAPTFSFGRDATLIGVAAGSNQKDRRRPRQLVRDLPRKGLPFVPQLARGSGAWAWPVRHETWNEEHTAAYEAFIRAIGESTCSTVHECLTNPVSNPAFAVTNPPGSAFYSDCADLPLLLRAYFAWRSNLPFSFAIRHADHPPTGNSPPGQQGLQVSMRHDVVGPGADFRQLMKAISDYVNSNHFRVPAHYKGTLLPDHYPVRLDRTSIRAGTVIYDPDGHVAVVYKVTEDGRIHYIDAHPDNSLTRGVYGRDFMRTSPDLGAGFKRWRPQRLVGATKNADGTLTGCRIELTPNSKLADWSDEQFLKLAPPRSPAGKKLRTVVDAAAPAHQSAETEFSVDGKAVDYYDYLRLVLAPRGFRYDPLTETRAMVKQLCGELQDRVQAVDRAIRAGLHRRPQPLRLPNNIYATQGEWELYSSPSRDARLKVMFVELHDEVIRFVHLSQINSQIVSYDGIDLARDLVAVFENEAQQCTTTYRRSDGTSKDLSFQDVRDRLFLMSFDPHHCPERRWGATEAKELASCPDDTTKREWYLAEQRLRNQTVRTYGEPMGWSLAELKDTKRDIGDDEAPNLDILGRLRAAMRMETATIPQQLSCRANETASCGESDDH